MRAQRGLIYSGPSPAPIIKTRLMESAKKNAGRPILEGVLQVADVKNANGRIYPSSVLMKEAARYKKQLVDENIATGELDHPESTIVSYDRVCMVVRDLWTENKIVKGIVEVVMTPKGQILLTLSEADIKLGVSSRGLASVVTESHADVVQNDLELICWDAVSIPSAPGAWVSMRKESRMENTYFEAADSSKFRPLPEPTVFLEQLESKEMRNASTFVERNNQVLAESGAKASTKEIQYYLDQMFDWRRK